MLLELTQWLAKDYRAFSVFNYITLRAVLATLTALFIGLIFGPAVIRRLTEMKIGQADSFAGNRLRLAFKPGRCFVTCIDLIPVRP